MERRPIILLGTHRSGTTWLGKVLSRHPDVAYFEEPRHVWTWGNARTPDDRLGETHARPRVVGHIHEVFDEHVRAHGKTRLCEKTPSNCLRVPFLRAVYPEAKLLLVVRDGRSVLRSAGEMAGKGAPAGRIWQRAKQTPLREWPAYAGQTASILARKLGVGGEPWWGPRPEGWKRWQKQDAREVRLAKQWAGTLGTAVRDLDALGEGSHYCFSYEGVMREPGRVMREIVEFAGLEGAGELVAHVEETADPSRVDKWRRELTDEQLDRVRPHMEPLLTELGYEW